MADRALLLIADIGGYTRFMKIHKINLAHAQYVVARLLEAVIDAAGSRWKLAKLEGDAAFFYRLVPGGASPDVNAAASLLLAMRDAFAGRRAQLARDRVCNCDACLQGSDLKIKFVLHAGEIAFQKIKRHTELAGLDVIFVHRLLKNSVPVPEYMLTSDAVHGGLPESLRDASLELEEDLEGLGTVRTHYVDLEPFPVPPLADPRKTFLRRAWHWLRMAVRTLPGMIGARRSCQDFRNLPGAGVHAQEDAA
jgi:hypothetical protein